jgi:hypothetical protein
VDQRRSVGTANPDLFEMMEVTASPAHRSDAYLTRPTRSIPIRYTLARRTGIGERRPPPPAHCPEAVREAAQVDNGRPFTFGSCCREFGKIGDQPWLSSNRTRSSLGIARAFASSGHGRFAAESPAGRQSREVSELIRRMSRENPLWGAPHIHGELLSGPGRPDRVQLIFDGGGDQEDAGGVSHPCHSGRSPPQPANSIQEIRFEKYSKGGRDPGPNWYSGFYSAGEAERPHPQPRSAYSLSFDGM